MTEVSDKLFSEMANGDEWVKPEKMLVLKKTGISYDAYYNETKNKFGPLLEATIYNDITPKVENAEIVDYRVITGLK